MEECSCVCKKQYNNKCTLLGKIVDDATCECKDRTQYTRGPGNDLFSSVVLDLLHFSIRMII